MSEPLKSSICTKNVEGLGHQPKYLSAFFEQQHAEVCRRGVGHQSGPCGTGYSEAGDEQEVQDYVERTADQTAQQMVFLQVFDEKPFAARNTDANEHASPNMNRKDLGSRQEVGAEDKYNNCFSKKCG